MARSRLLRVGAIAVILLLATVIALAVGLVVADKRGFSARICSATAFEVEDDPSAVELPPALLDEHPEVLVAIRKVDPPSGGTENISCESLDEMRADVAATGARMGEHGYLVRHEGRAYELELSLAVA